MQLIRIFACIGFVQGIDRNMRRSRIQGDPERESCYHIMSRTTGGQMLFGDYEKNVFARQLRKHAEFAGIDVMTWCKMDNKPLCLHTMLLF